MKKPKKDSSTSYSKIAIFAFLLFAVYWGIKDSFLNSELNSKTVLEDSSDEIIADEFAETQVSAAVSTASISEEKVEKEEDPRMDKVVGREPLPANLAEFEKYLVQIQKELPVLGDFQRLSAREVHHTPDILVAAGEKMGTIADLLSRNTNYYSAGLIFYSNCYSRKDLPDSLRALCLVNHRKMRTSHGGAFEWNEDEIENSSIEVRELAEHVTF